MLYNKEIEVFQKYQALDFKNVLGRSMIKKKCYSFVPGLKKRFMINL